MSLPARPVTFGRPTQQQPYQYQQPQYQQQQQQQHGLALPMGNLYMQPPSTGLALPGPSPLSNSFTPTHSQPQSNSQSPPSPSSNAVAGPSSPSTPPIPSTPAPLTLEQQHITAVEGIVPTLQNIVATVNLDCRLDLKTIALHARNAEYNPKVGICLLPFCVTCRTARFVSLSVLQPSSCVSGIRRRLLSSLHQERWWSLVQSQRTIHV